MYSDEFEIANALGSKSKKHKINGFYCKILNLEDAGLLENIFVYAVALARHVKRYGYNQVLLPFVRDFKRLANGFNVNLHGREVEIKLLLSGLTGDTLGMHEILHMLSPSCSYFCRDCMISKAKYHLNPSFIARPRTEQHRANLVRRAQMVPGGFWLLKKYGYQTTETILTRIGFKPRLNHRFDLMHDLFEGCSMVVISAILKFCFTKKIFTDEFLNQRIEHFNYGQINDSTKPTANIDEKTIKYSKTYRLKQSGAQMHTLVRVLPFILRDKLEEYYENTSDEWEKHLTERVSTLLSLHLELVQLICSRSLTRVQLDDLERVVAQHNYVYCQFRDDSDLNPPLIQKFHHLYHYRQMIEEFGPAPIWSTFRFEALHHILKQRMQSSNNYVNPPKTICDRIAIAFSYKYSYEHQKPTFEKRSCKPCIDEYGNLKFIGKSASFHGTLYHQKQVVCIDVRNNEDDANIVPVFGLIESMEYQEEELTFKLELLRTVGYDLEFGAYRVEQAESESVMITWDQLVIKEPQAIWRNCSQDPNEENNYVSMKQYFI